MVVCGVLLVVCRVVLFLSCVRVCDLFLFLPIRALAVSVRSNPRRTRFLFKLRANSVYLLPGAFASAGRGDGVGAGAATAG